MQLQKKININEILFFKKKVLLFQCCFWWHLPFGPPTSWLLYVLVRWLLTSCHSSQKPHWLLVQSISSSQEGKAGLLCLICMCLRCQVQWAPFARSIMRTGKLTQPRSLTRKSTQTVSLLETMPGSVLWWVIKCQARPRPPCVAADLWDPQKPRHMQEIKSKFLLPVLKGKKK